MTPWIGECLVAQGRLEEAEPYLLDSLAVIEAALGRSHRRTQDAVRRIVALYDAWDRPDDAATYRARLD